MIVSNITLIKIGAVGGIVTVSMGLMLRQKINNQIKQTDYYKEAIKTVRAHKGAIHLLGEPIKDGRIDVGDSERNFTKPDTAHYEVPLRGSKQQGVMHFWANRQNKNQWIVDRIELDIQNEKGRRLLIKK